MNYLEEKLGVNLELLVDASIDKEDVTWFSGLVCKGVYKGLNFEIHAENLDKHIRLLKKTPPEPTYEELINTTQSSDSIDLIPKILKDLSLPLEDETIYAIENDDFGINNIVGEISDYEERFIIKIEDWVGIRPVDSILSSTVEETLDIIDEYALGDLELNFKCNICEQSRTTEDIIQDVQAAGFEDYTLDNILKSDYHCPNCDSSDIKVTKWY